MPATKASTQADCSNETINKMQKDIQQLKDFQRNTAEKLDGYAKKVKAWTTTITDTKKIVNNLAKEWEEHKKTLENQKQSICTKTKEYTKTETRMKTVLQECETKKKELIAQLENTKIINNVEVKDISESQTFVSKKYDELREEIGDMKKKLAKNIVKTEQNNKYPRRDCVEFKEVPYTPNSDGRENCKEVITNICKELHLWLPEMAISTAHRLNQRANRVGPAPIIVKFVSRDIRNDVYQLRHHIKEKTKWRLYGTRKLYINESLSPETRKLLYQTKLFSREMRKEKIHVWTFKGDVYLRKDAVGAPKIKVTSEQDLKQITEGTISLDRSNLSVNTTSNENIYYILSNDSIDVEVITI